MTETSIEKSSGVIPNVDKSMREYVISINNVLNENENEEDSNDLLTNVFAELSGKEISLACDRQSSTALEVFFNKCTNLDIIIQLVKTFTNSIAEVAFHSCGSRVLQTLLRKVHTIVNEKQRIIEQDEKTTFLSLQKAIGSLCESCGQLWPDLVYDINGSHVVRSIIALLSGIEEPRNTDEGDNYRKKQSVSLIISSVPKKFQTRLTSTIATIIESLQNCSSLAVCALSPQPCSVLVFFLTALSKHPILQNALASKFIQPLLLGIDESNVPTSGKESVPDEYKDQVFGSSLIYNSYGSHLVEASLPLLDEQTFTELYNKRFRDHLIEFSEDLTANHVVQKLVNSCPNKAILSLIIIELLPAFPQLIVSRAGVILVLLQAANKVSIQQKEIVDTLVDCCANMETSKEKANGSKNVSRGEASIHFIANLLSANNYLRSMIAQELLKIPLINGGGIVLRSLLAIPRVQLFQLALSPHGSRFVEALFKSPIVLQRNQNTETNITEKNQKPTIQTLLERFKGKYGELACDSNGCHCVEACYSVADAETKEKICKELVAMENRIDISHWGKIVLLTCNISEFKLKHDDWVKNIQKKEKKRQMFTEILQTENILSDAKLQEGDNENDMENNGAYESFLQKLGFGQTTRACIQLKTTKKAKTTEHDIEEIGSGKVEKKNEIDQIFSKSKGSKRKRKKNNEKREKRVPEKESTKPLSDFSNDDTMISVLNALQKGKKKKTPKSEKKKSKFAMM